ncbi:MAG: hypothetical protein R6V02_07320 [Candidatus Aminicenantes bacterium]
MKRLSFWDKRWRLMIISLVSGLFLLGILRVFESYFEELLAAFVFGGLAFIPSRKPRSIILGALVASAGWLIGLAVSNHCGLTIGLGFGTWTLMSFGVFSILGVKFIRDKKTLRGLFIAFLGLGIGLGIEIVQILPSFVHFLRFQDSQVLGVLSAAVMIPSVAALLDRHRSRKENSDETS